MPLGKKDKEYLLPLITVAEAKTIDLERTLTNFLVLLRYNGVPIVQSSAKAPTVQSLTDVACGRDVGAHLTGFSEHRDVVRRWLESDIVDLVNRGNPAKERLSAPRPLHLTAYRLRNPSVCRDYGTSAAVFNLLVWEAGDVLDTLREFFAEGLDPHTDGYDGVTNLDIETTFLLRLVADAPGEQKDPKRKPIQAFPLCISDARRFADDLRRLLAYRDQVPRQVMISYLETVIGLHLGLYTLHLFHLLPTLVEQGDYPAACICRRDGFDESVGCTSCPLRPSIVVDLGDNHRSRMAELARQSAREQMDALGRYTKAHMTIKKLHEYAGYLEGFGKLASPPQRVVDVLAMRDWPDPVTFQAYFMQRISTLMDVDDNAEIDHRLLEIQKLGLPPLETYIEMLFLLRQRFHTQHYTQFLDSLLQKNQESALLRQGRGPINQRRFAIGSQLLETLAQIAALKPAGDGFSSEPMLVDDFLTFLRDRYGIYVGELPHDDAIPPADLAALRTNVAEFKRRLREIGLYTDLSDAYIAQTVRPRFRVGALA